MSLGYSDDLRIRVVRAVDNGISRRGAARQVFSWGQLCDPLDGIVAERGNCPS